MKNFVFMFLIGFLLLGCQGGSTEDEVENISSSDQILITAFKNKESGLQVEGKGIVKSLLSDDTTGVTHQRFILVLDSSQTLLVAHNIDVAPRVSPLQIGDTVEFYGEYEWNAEGGVIHWTHSDPGGVHIAGWLKHNGIEYY
jgi:hypothetical protein